MQSTNVSGLTVVVVVIFVIGVALFGVGTSMLHALRRSKHPQWPTRIDESLTEADPSLRRDLIERLSLVHSDWSRETLRAALEEERDPSLRSMIESALQ